MPSEASSPKDDKSSQRAPEGRPANPIRKGDLCAIEVDYLTVALSGITGKPGKVYHRIAWHIVRAATCTKAGRLREAVDAAGTRYKMLEKCRAVKRIVPVPEVTADALFAASEGLSWAEPGEVADFARPFIGRLALPSEPPAALPNPPASRR
jgi:hypothetical protein